MKKLITLLTLLSGAAFAQLPNTTNQYIPMENHQVNGGFENGKSGFVASAGTFAITSSASNVARGGFAASMDFSAALQTLTSPSKAIPSGLYGNNCIAEAMVKGFDTNVTMEVYDGTNVVASQALVAYPTYTKISIPFVCPSSGNISLRLKASADALIGYWDDLVWGANYRVGTVSQATFVGSAYIPKATNCQWDTTSSSLVAFSADTDCVDNFTVENAVTGGGTFSTATNDLPKFTITDLPPGKYMVTMNGNIGSGASARVDATISDGTTSSGRAMLIGTSTANLPISVVGSFVYTTAGTRSFSMYLSTDTGTASLRNSEANGQIYFSIVKYPSQSETVYAANMQAAFAKVDIAPAAGRSLTTASSTHVTLNNTNITAGRTNYGVCLDPTVAGDFGCRFAKLPAGKYLVQIPSETQGSGGNGHTAYRVKETVSGVVGQEGYMTTNGGQGASPIVGMLIIPSEIINANIVVQARCDGATTCGFDTVNYPASLEIFPVEQGIPMPVVLNSVQSTYAGQMRMETAFITNNGSNCVVSEEYGDWIASPTRGGTGNCAIPFNTAFSQNPHCVGSIYQAVGMNLRIQAISTSSVTIETFNSGGANTDQNYQLICFGPK